MAWGRKITDTLADVLRFAMRGALLIDGIAIAGASVYVVVKMCWYTLKYLDSSLFAEPW